MNLAFAGFRHGHIYAILEWAKNIPELSITAAWESDPAARAEAESKGVRFTHETYESLIADPSIDVLAIGNYYGARGQMIIQALSAGKSVIADKPICTSLEELEQIAALTRSGKAQLGCMLDLRYQFAPQKVRELILSGELGKVCNIVFTGCHPLNYGVRPGWYFEEGKHGGTINDIAIHGMDLIRFMTGAGMSKILASRVWNAFAANEPDFCDCAQFMAELDGGIGLIADVSYSSPSFASAPRAFYWRFNIFCEKGSIEFNYGENQIHLIRTGIDGEEILTGDSCRTDPLDDFVKALNGEPAFLPQEEILAATRDVLLLQQFAEQNR